MVLESSAGGTIAAPRTIEVIYVENDTAYVTGALKDGDLVIADGTHRIVPGQNVAPAAQNNALSSSTEPPLVPSSSDEPGQSERPSP